MYDLLFYHVTLNSTWTCCWACFLGSCMSNLWIYKTGVIYSL